MKNMNNDTIATVGNTAKMCEALKSLMDNLQIHAVMPCEQITMNRAEVCAMIEDCRAALAAPPRNCDNAATWLDLYSHFHPPKGMREMPPEWVDAIVAFCQWLVATPKAKGATDGSK